MKEINAHHSLDVRNVAAFVAIDWADKVHVGCLVAAGSESPEDFEIDHTPEAIDEWVYVLRQRFAGRTVAVCLEQRRGALIFALLKYDFLVLCPINPRQFARYREALDPGGAKDDPTDARLMLDFLVRHHDRLRVWKPDDEQTRLIELLTEHKRNLVDQRTRLVNELNAVLKQYFPQAAAILARQLASKMACAFLAKWPTLEALQRAKPHTIRKFFYAQNSRSETRIEQRLELIAQATPLVTDPALLEACSLRAASLVARLRALHGPIADVQRRIRELMRTHQDGELFECLPGAGEVLAPRLLAAFGNDRARYETADEIQSYSGIAPVTRRTGGPQAKGTVSFRWACPKFLRQTFHEFAQHSRSSSIWARAYYELQTSRGKSHHAAVRALAYKWIRIIYRCWQTRTKYDEQRYLDSLRKRQSPLAERIKNIAA